MDKRMPWGARLGRMVFYPLMAAGLGLMTAASTSYAELGREHPFFIEKLPFLTQPELWLLSLYVHVPSALLALPACLLLQLRAVRARAPRLHRVLGRITAALVMLAVVPSGMYLASFAQGGLVTTLGFWLTGLIAFVAMLQSVRAARARDFRSHRRFSMHVTAQLSVAVLSRVLLFSAEAAALYAEWVYVAALYVPVIGCACAVEWMTGPKSRPSNEGVRHESVVAVPGVDPVR